MLNVGALTQTQSTDIFTKSDSIKLLPVVSAEWNHNLFNPPYITTAGTGAVINWTSEVTTPDVTTGKKENFTTKSFNMSGGTGSVSYTKSGLSGKAYKIITYIKTNSSTPVMITAFAKGTSNQYGSESIEADSLGWTKAITYIGSYGSLETISSFVYKITANSISGDEVNPTVYFTKPEIYETTKFDLYNNSLFPTDAPFKYFRPGESYVSTGNAKYSFPAKHRKITSKLLNTETLSAGVYGNKYSPISSILQNPSFFLAAPPMPTVKSVLPSDLAPYKYFVSDSTSKSITAIYKTSILTNKLVLKFNTLMAVPTINISINDSVITVDGSQAIVPPTNSDSVRTGVIVLYWTGSAWTKTPWTTMPQFNSAGALSISTNINKITVTQTLSQPKTEMSSVTGVSTPTSNIALDLQRMHLIEISPRLEIDLTDFVENVEIEKSLDSAKTALPLSSVNTNDARISLSAIPAINGSTLVPIFSSQSNQTSTVLANILRKNIKFYINFNLVDYVTAGSTPTINSNPYIPGGVFYSDTWEENDIANVSIQCFDVSRYLQSTPVPDYVANLKTVFEVITNILDLAGFTDYDYDSLYKICNSKSNPLDLSYYYCNSKDTTVLDALSQIFIAYQIGAYIDEYGIMKFLSLKDILSSPASIMTISDSDILEGGFTISNAAKPGKIALRYQTPKVKQSPSLQNVTNLEIKNSPSFIYTTSNDVVWQQQTIDSVGFNYLDATMSEDSNVFKINNNDLMDIFHTFNMNNEGYAAIENEIVSFVYKEYELTNMDNNNSKKVSIKNNLQLSSEINQFIKESGVLLKQKAAIVTNAIGDGVLTTYTAANDFATGDRITISGMVPTEFNISGTVLEADSTSFIMLTTSHSLNPVTKAGAAITASTSDILITPTGNITNVKRGMFGTAASEHKRITSLASKGLSEKKIDRYYNTISSSNTASIINSKTANASITDILPSIDKIRVQTFGTDKTIIYPTDAVDQGYHTYSVKFDMPDQAVTTAGLFFNMKSTTEIGDALFVELIKYNSIKPGTVELYDPPRYKYILTIRDFEGYTIAWSEVTGECQNITNNFCKIINKTLVDGKYEYDYINDDAFNLKVVYYVSDGSDGENASEEYPSNIFSVFLNNVEIHGWQRRGLIAGSETDGTGYNPTSINPLTGTRQKPEWITEAVEIVPGTKFGFISSSSPNLIDGLYPQLSFPTSNSNHASSLREIHATTKPLKERSVSYFYQDREFLNGLVQDQSLASLSPSYIMQTTPSVSGINVYDVQYTSPAAVSVDVLPVEYLWYYFPGDTPQDQKNYQKKLVDEYSLSYSTPINTGFRAKLAIANNAPHLVFLRKESDDLNQFTINLNLWTHEIVAPSDPEILERIIDESNPSEVVQLDSQWIQSKEAATKMLKIVQMAIDGFSKTVLLEIFGNPLIQVGDVITLNYSLNGISGQKYMVQSVSHSFGQGLSTSLKMNRLE
jgi:hypothetical protein